MGRRARRDGPLSAATERRAAAGHGPLSAAQSDVRAAGRGPGRVTAQEKNSFFLFFYRTQFYCFLFSLLSKICTVLSIQIYPMKICLENTKVTEIYFCKV